MDPLALDPNDPRALLAAIGRLRGAALVFAAAERVETPVHLVGGAVRDLLTGVRPRELDLVVEGDPAPFTALLGGSVTEHGRFGTATVQLTDGTTIDVARSRSETYAHPGALPDVEPAPLTIDLHRRDATINAIAIDVRTGAVTAAGTALGDLQARVLRVLHLGSFTDDPTRLWRLARYEVRLGADWDPITWHLAQAAIGGGALATVSRERLASELRLALREPDPLGALAAAARLGLPPHVDRDALRLHQAERLAGGEIDHAELVLAAVATDDPELRRYLASGAEHALIDAALALRAPEGHGWRPGPLPAGARGTQIRDRFDGLPLAAVATAPDDEAAARWLADLRHRRLLIDGGALLAAGVPQGEAVGRGLAVARDAMLDGIVRADDREAQLQLAIAAAC
ncbi:MAG: hypothetical protein PGN13_08295 [Patulibacter minatonensis]